jgi:hypothetical protein
MTTRAKGTFEVELNPQGPQDKPEAATLARTAIAKRFHGDLDAVSKGEMLSAMTDITGSGGYVAIERVTGALHGRAGALVLQHTGAMTRGVAQLVVSVVPDSGATWARHACTEKTNVLLWSTMNVTVSHWSFSP